MSPPAGSPAAGGLGVADRLLHTGPGGGWGLGSPVSVVLARGTTGRGAGGRPAPPHPHLGEDDAEMRTVLGAMLRDDG